MKKVFRVLVSVIIICTLFLTGCQRKDENVEVKEAVTPLFYKIKSNENDATVYLLGSIHAADDSIYPLSDIIMSAYNESDYLAVEVDITNLDYELQLEVTEKMFCEDGITIKDYLGEELYNQMVKVLKEKKSYSPFFDYYKPVFFQSLFENLIIKDAGLNTNKGVDMYFLNLAKEDEKGILEIETAEFQYDLLLNSSEEVFKMTLDGYVNDYDNSVLGMKFLYTAWKQGNAFALKTSTYEFSKKGLNEEQITAFENYIHSFIVERNYGMVNTIEKYMSEGKNVFCVVGVGHVIGDEGIVSLMEKLGYKVEKIDYEI